MNVPNRQQGNRHWISFSLDLFGTYQSNTGNCIVHCALGLPFLENMLIDQKTNGTHKKKISFVEYGMKNNNCYVFRSPSVLFLFFRLMLSLRSTSIRSSISNTFSVLFPRDLNNKWVVTWMGAFFWVLIIAKVQLYRSIIRDHDQSLIWFFHLLQLLKCTVMIAIRHHTNTVEFNNWW